ncbi:MAG: phage tail protein [Chloroflexi bacterium]|nr:phage tail protein [Chloroflexota bacterium]
MPTTEEAYPSYRFYVEIASVPQAVFTEVSGLQVETDVTELEEGGNNDFVHRLPGRTKVSNITLKRGMTSSNELLQWYLKIARGTIDRRNVTIIMYDSAGKELFRWNFIEAYPVKWVGPQFTADSTSAAVETLELTHNGMTLG